MEKVDEEVWRIIYRLWEHKPTQDKLNLKYSTVQLNAIISEVQRRMVANDENEVVLNSNNNKGICFTESHMWSIGYAGTHPQFQQSERWWLWLDIETGLSNTGHWREVIEEYYTQTTCLG